MVQPSPIIRMSARALFVLLVILATLGADQAERLGLATLRMPLFMMVVVAQVALGLLVRPVPDEPDAIIGMLLALIVGVIAVLDLRGTVDPIDYKLLLPVAALLASGPISDSLGSRDLPAWLWRILSVYVLATALVVFSSDTAELARGADGIVRIDASGSLVTHSAFCTIHLVLSAVTFRPAALPGKLARLIVGVCSLAMLLAAATRTPFLTLSFAMAMLLVAAPDRGRWARRLPVGAMLIAVALLIYSLCVDASLWRRLWSDGQAEWSTGRTVAIDYWIQVSLDHPLGLGLGAVRDALGEGKPALDGEAILDWPHNEAIRLWVEAGPFGLAFLILLLGTLLVRCLELCRRHSDHAMRAAAAVIMADALAQSMFQNWLNGVYHATFGVLVVCLLWRPQPNRQTAAISSLTLQRTAV
jgi:hypothetical protein